MLLLQRLQIRTTRITEISLCGESIQQRLVVPHDQIVKEDLRMYVKEHASQHRLKLISFYSCNIKSIHNSRALTTDTRTATSSSLA